MVRRWTIVLRAQADSKLRARNVSPAAIASLIMEAAEATLPGVVRAHSDEVETGSSKECASKQGSRGAGLMQSGRIRL